MAEDEGQAEIWRGWHVIGRFLPMIFLGCIFVLYGVSPLAPHNDGVHLGLVFVLAGGILLIGAVVGMLFTKCPVCYRTNWIYCVQEPDVVRQHDRLGKYYTRDLASPNHERRDG